MPITGIGNPDRFIKHLKTLNLRPNNIRIFDDHHSFNESDFWDYDSNDLDIIMTEKEFLIRVGHNLRVKLMSGNETIFSVTDFINDRGLNISTQDASDLMVKGNKYWMLWGDCYLYIDGLFDDGFDLKENA